MALKLPISRKLLLLLFDTAVSIRKYRRQSDKINSSLLSHSAAFTVPQTKRNDSN